jgi:hypothetical protein
MKFKIEARQIFHERIPETLYLLNNEDEEFPLSK